MANELIINGTIHPLGENEPTHDALYGKGGLKVRDNLANLGAITVPHLTFGTLGYAYNTRIIYTYAGGTTWNAVLLTNANMGPDIIESDNIADASILVAHLNAEVTDDLVTLTRLTDELDLYATMDYVSGGFQSSMLNEAPTTITSDGDKGNWSLSSDGSNDYLYICVADDSWKRVLLSTW